jgi:hypothetical protein
MFLHKALVHSLTFDCETLTAEAIQAIVYEADEQKFTDMYQARTFINIIYISLLSGN